MDVLPSPINPRIRRINARVRLASEIRIHLIRLMTHRGAQLVNHAAVVAAVRAHERAAA